MVIKKFRIIIGIFIFINIFLLSFASGEVLAWKDSYCADCPLPWGGTIHSDLNVTAYLSNSVNCGSVCTSESRVCNNGTLSGSYTNATCGIINCPCSLPWGGNINSGQSIIAYLTSSVNCGLDCTSEIRICDNGYLIGNYTNPTCGIINCPCSLPWGGVINSGQSVTAYLTSSVNCGSTCTNETRTCNNGVLSGNYNNSGCSIINCPCSLPWGGTISSGQSVTAYLTSSVNCGSVCTSETRTCNNVVLSGSYTNATCGIVNCPCSLPWGGTINSGQSVTAYLTSSVNCGSTCTSETRTCNNGALSGSYTNSGCSVGACTCSLPWGGTISSGQSVTAYLASSVPCGSTCTSQTRTCTNGVLSGSYTNSGCSVGCCPNCGCAANTCSGSTCSDGCGGTCWGTRCCGSCGDTNNYCSGTPYGDGCGGTCWGTRNCCDSYQIYWQHVHTWNVCKDSNPASLCTRHDDRWDQGTTSCSSGYWMTNIQITASEVISGACDPYCYSSIARYSQSATCTNC